MRNLLQNSIEKGHVALNMAPFGRRCGRVADYRKDRDFNKGGKVSIIHFNHAFLILFSISTTGC